MVGGGGLRVTCSAMAAQSIEQSYQSRVLIVSITIGTANDDQARVGRPLIKR